MVGYTLSSDTKHIYFRLHSVTLKGSMKRDECLRFLCLDKSHFRTGLIGVLVINSDSLKV